MKDLAQGTLESSELVDETLKFWFKDNNHIRSPFPEYIRPELKKMASKSFFRWTSNLNPKAKDEVNDEMIAEKFEEIIFEEALKLVLTADEKITIRYPFLPRLGDELSKSEVENEKSTVIDRNIYKDGDYSFLKVMLEKQISKQKWDTSFELPL